MTLKRRRISLSCPDCGGYDVRFRVRSKSYYCRRCGYHGTKTQFAKPKGKV